MGQLERAVFVNTLTEAKVPVMFNPAEVSIKKAVPWKEQERPGKDQPNLQFTAGKARTISLKLDYDTSGLEGDGGDAVSVLDYIDPLLVLATVPVKIKDAYPPVLYFMWGSGLKITCVIKSINVTYTRFNADGVPTRGKVQVELMEWERFTYLDQMVVDAIDARLVQVQEGETVSTETARENEIDNPKKPGTGTVYSTR